LSRIGGNNRLAFCLPLAIPYRSDRGAPTTTDYSNGVAIVKSLKIRTPGRPVRSRQQRACVYPKKLASALGR
jgi:hypothetical protein